MIKYGFRYTTGEQWGRLRKLYRRAMVLKTFGAVLAAVVLALLAPFADSIFNADGLQDAVPARRAAPGHVRPGGSRPARRSCSPGATTSGPATSFLTQLLRAIGLVVGAHYGVTEAVLGLVLGQIAGSIAVGRAAISGVPAVPRGGARAARRGPAGDRPVRDPVEHRLRDRLAAAARSSRSCSATVSVPEARSATSAPRQAPQTGLAGADLAGAADPDHRADPRLGGGGDRPRVREPAPVQPRRARADGRARCRSSTG